MHSMARHCVQYCASGRWQSVYCQFDGLPIDRWMAFYFRSAWCRVSSWSACDLDAHSDAQWRHIYRTDDTPRDVISHVTLCVQWLSCMESVQPHKSIWFFTLHGRISTIHHRHQMTFPYLIVGVRCIALHSIFYHRPEPLLVRSFVVLRVHGAVAETDWDREQPARYAVRIHRRMLVAVSTCAWLYMREWCVWTVELIIESAACEYGEQEPLIITVCYQCTVWCLGRA